MNSRIYLSPPHVGNEELELVKDVFATNWISPAGPHIEMFEYELAAFNGVPYAAALASGTAAIHLALIVLGVEPGDEVICSSFTFAGTCNPIVYLHASPVFVDSEESTWNMDPVLLEEAIVDGIKRGKKPRAIILVHLYGMPARLDEILSVAARYEIPIIEDAAEGLGASYQGRKLGSFGHLGVFSFNGNKIITTSGGGALVSDDESWIKRAKFLSTQARDPFPHYEHTVIGYNYRLSNVCAAIGVGQMRVLDKRVDRKREIFEFYQKRFAIHSAISFQPEIPGSYSNRWLTTVVFDSDAGVSPEQVRLELEKHNIETRPLWKPMHLQPVFQSARCFVNGVSEKLFACGLCLPSGTALSEDQLSRIADLTEDALNKRGTGK